MCDSVLENAKGHGGTVNRMNDSARAAVPYEGGSINRCSKGFYKKVF